MRILLNLMLLILMVGKSYTQHFDKSLSEVVRKSDIIAYATVVSKQSEWRNDSKGNHIYTKVKLRINDLIKGKLNDSFFEIIIKGGEVGNITEEVLPSISLTQSEEVLLFLKQNPLSLIDGFYLKFNILNDIIYFNERSYPIKALLELIKEIDLGNYSSVSFDEIEFSIQQRNRTFPIIDTIRIPSELNDLSNYSIPHSTLLANLTFFKPSDWSDKIIISNRTGAKSDAKLYSTNNIYASWGIINNGDVAIGLFSVHLYVDGNRILSRTYSAPGIAAGESLLTTDYPLGILSKGTHSFKVILDAWNNVQESDESDNEYSKSLIINDPTNYQPIITNISPPFASAGTGSEVKISGKNFGNSQDSGTVEFFYCDRQPKIIAPIKSWTDNEIICYVPIATIDGYPASASSGPVTITTDAGSSTGYPFNILFGTSLNKWANNQTAIPFKINENCDKVLDEGDAIKLAAESWNSAGANFRFVYSGSTSSTTASYNGVNEIMFSDCDELGAASIWKSNSKIIEIDVIFNKTKDWGTDPLNGRMDIRTTALHEFGHWLSLRDLYGSPDWGKAMYGVGTAGKMNRVLSTGDVAGIQFVYGANEIPVAPNLILPMNYSNSISLNTTLSWSNVNKSTSYQLQLSTNPDFNLIVKDTIEIFNTFVAIENLFQNKIYYWRVRALNVKGASDWSDVWSFRTIAQSPDKPVLIAPINNQNEISTPLKLIWNSSTNVLNYQVQISKTSNFSILDKDTNGITTNFVEIFGLASNTKYYWRVRACNSSGYSSWSETWAFWTKSQLPNIPVLLSPNDLENQISTSPILSWNKSNDVQSFHLQISFDLFFKEIIYEDSTIVDTSINIKNLAGNKNYYWRVASKNNYGKSNWSIVWSFKTLNHAPSHFSLLRPILKDSIMLTYPEKLIQFVWNKSVDPDIYDTVRYSITILVDGLTIGLQNILDTTAFLDLVKYLKPTKSYQWYVKSTDQLVKTKSDTCVFSVSYLTVKVNQQINNKPLSTILYQNYPNPFNPSTRIEYSIPENSVVIMKIFNTLGTEVETLVNRNQQAGTYQVTWQPKSVGGGLPSGVYYYKIQAGSYSETKKMIYVR